ncbi:DUF3558 family protein [Streptomyces sp. NPDC052301]|uniref:DUF3558 family protein n=1 Tax=Streptomyces sp. NPDC052301 TaxID=3365687 RepID=UPI0037D8D066
MQRAAQRDDRAQQEKRSRRLSRVLVCAAAVPAVLITAACSSDSGDAKSKGVDSGQQQSASSAAPSASASPTVQAAAYRKLPDSCAVLTKKTLGDLVPKGVSSAKKGSSDDPSSRSSCSWNSLDNNGVKGSQFRWLNVSLLRFDSDATRGTGEAQAHAYYGRQIKDAQAVEGAKNASSQPVSGVGAEATAVRYDLKKKEGLFKQQTVVARVENVVVTLDYNGAGLAGEKTPDAGDLAKAAEKAVKEAVASVSSANGEGSGSGSSTSSASPSKSASASPSKSPSTSPSKSASSSASPSKSAAQKR